MSVRFILGVFSLSLVAACGGGGGGGGGGGTVITPTQSDFQRGIFSASAQYKDMCQNPRAGTGDMQGSTTDENDWLRAWSHDLYLWYDEIIDEDPAAYSDVLAYFDLMRTFETTPSGAPKDQFHFTYDTEVWRQLLETGTSAGYGAEVVLLSTTPPRRAVVAYVVDGGPADLAGIERGTVIVAVDGVDLVNGNDVDTLNDGLFPSAADESHEFGIEDFDGSNPRTVTMVSQDVTEDTVPIATVFDTTAGPVGYIHFTAFLAPAEERLVTEIQAMATAGITELILDVRYNGGGLLGISSQLAYMIAGPSAAGQVFEEIQFNDKHPNVNPVTGQTLVPLEFLTTTQNFSVGFPAGQTLPTLNLSRVFVLSGSRTASASESLINGLRGINIPVILIGAPTTGKPYGFYATDNCGTTYFSIQFRGVNAQGFGDFADGFVPTETPVELYEVQGCDVADDFSRQLGDPNEWRLATALEYITSSDCSGAPITIQPGRRVADARLEADSRALFVRSRIPGKMLTP